MIRLLPFWTQNAADALTRAWDLSGESAMALLVGFAFLSAVIGYLLGSLNFAIIISRFTSHDDIRTHGSGNAGTTNMLRTYGPGAAVATMVCDMLKAALATLIGSLLASFPIGAPIAGFFCVFGHMFPIFYRFRGGKGVACTAIVALMLDPWTFLVMFFVFFAIVAMSRFVSLASVMCALLYPLLLHAFCPTGGWIVLMGVVTSAFVVFMHRENLKRLYHGKESKISFSRKGKSGAEEQA